MKYKSLSDVFDELDGVLSRRTFNVLYRSGYLDDLNIYSLDGITLKELKNFRLMGETFIKEVLKVCDYYGITVIDDSKCKSGHYDKKDDYVIRIITRDSCLQYLCKKMQEDETYFPFTLVPFIYDRDLVCFKSKEEGLEFIKNNIELFRDMKGIFCVKRTFSDRFSFSC